ncbi:unnamed protein product [Closterium sp. NIES-64]|nr:unnamed protein product [Closterium sp. NIES-64]
MRRIPVAVWRAIAVLRAVLPRGSWWDLQQLAGGKAARGKGASGDSSSSGDSSGKGSGGGDSPGELWDAIRKLWRFCAPNRTMLLSEVTIPHFLAATIFAASNGLKPQFDRNVHLLITMTLACGLFRCASCSDNLSDTDLPSSPLRSSHSCLFLPSSGLRAASFTILNLQMVRRMRLALYETLIRQDIAFFDGQSVGDLTSRLGSDCQAAGHTVAIDLNIMLRNALQVGSGREGGREGGDELWVRVRQCASMKGAHSGHRPQHHAAQRLAGGQWEGGRGWGWLHAS